MQERTVHTITGASGLGQLYVPSGEHPGLYTAPGAPDPHYEAPGDVTSASGFGAMDTDKATLFILLGVGLFIAGWVTMDK